MTNPAAGTQKTTQNRFPLPLLVDLWVGFKAWLRRDGVVIVSYAITTLVMTYPLAFKLGGQWLAWSGFDTYMKLWDSWWLQDHAFNEPSLFYTRLLFHPDGLDLSHHSISWTVAFLSWGLAEVTDAITAYNVTVLIAIFSTAYAAYLLARPFVRYPAAAWLAGAIYSFAPYHIAHSAGHPDLVHLAPIPIAVLLLFTAVTKRSILAALGAALMIGLAAFTSLYIMVFALLTIGPVLVFLLLDKHRWSQREIWPVVVAFILASALLLSIRLIPIFRDTGALAAAIGQKYAAKQFQTNLLSYVLPSQSNPLFAPYTSEIASRFGSMSSSWPAYLGLIPLALIVVALTWKKQRNIVLLWFSIGLIFVILSLGPVLRFNENLYENIVLPARYLSWFPPIRAVGRPDLFVMGVLLPVAMLAAFGFDRLLIGLERRRALRLALMMALPGLLLVEYWSGEFPVVYPTVNPFYEQMARDPGDYAIIQLPMGRGVSKRYLFLQTIHQKSIVEGLSARTPDEAYQYIRSNALLLNWSRRDPLNCSILNRRRIISALDELIDDDFRYVIVQNRESKIPGRFADYFSVEPFYQDSDLTAFNLADVRHQLPCPDILEQGIDLPSPETLTSISWDQKISLLGYDLPDIDPDSSELSLTLYWQALTEIEDSYIVYFHLIDSETDSLVAQADVIPRGWSYPTSWWMTGEVVEDTVQIPMENVPPGRYKLHIGWYDEQTGIRLTPNSDQLQLSSDGSALLDVIEG